MASIKPNGNACNLSCQYCYQNVLRDGGQRGTRFDFAAVRRAIDQVDELFGLFGGEPLLLPLPDLEEVFAYGLDRQGQNEIQTNGALIESAHMALFERYNVSVGISIDGPDSLNDARWAGSLEKTRAATARTLRAIDWLVEAGQPPSLMVQLTRANAVGDALDRLCAWLTELDERGIGYARIHVLETDRTAARESYGLTVHENVTALRTLATTASKFNTLRLDLMTEQRELLLMNDASVACVFTACDPLYTSAVFSVSGDGRIEKCGLTDREGVNFERPETERFERYFALSVTPQEAGGCRDCRFLAVCKGQCPGTGIGGDWRNRSENCDVWRTIFTLAEQQLVSEGAVPLSLHPRRAEVEGRLRAAWSQGENPALIELRNRMAIDCSAGGSREDVAKAERKPSSARFASELGRVMPRFLRLAWVSPQARETWQPRILEATRAQPRRAIDALLHGRPVPRVFSIAPSEVPMLMNRLLGSAYELVVLGTDLPAAMESLLCAKSHEGNLWCCVSVPAELPDLKSAWAVGTVGAFAAAAAIPACCAMTAQRTRSRIDAEWRLMSEQNTDRVDQLNYRLHRLGVVPLPYFACEPNCASSLALAQALRSEEADALLKAPMRWSALHGIAEVLTPIVRSVFDCLPSDGLHSSMSGELAASPAEAPTGVGFPFRPAKGKTVAEGVSFHRGLANITLRQAALGFGGVDRISLSAGQLLPDRPVLLELEGPSWPAFERWTPPFLQRRLGNAPIAEALVPGGQCAPRSFGEFLDHVLNNGDHAGQYLFGFRFEDEAPEMVSDYSVPEVLRSWHYLLDPVDQPTYRVLLLGGATTGTPLHQEALDTDTFVAVIWGRKRWAFCPPGSDARVLGASVDLFNPGTQQRLAHAGIDIHYCEQRPRDVLFVPNGWWHQVKNTAPTLALSENIVTERNADRVLAKIKSPGGPVTPDLLTALRRCVELGRQRAVHT